MAEPPELTKHQNSVRLSILLPLRSIYFLSFVKKDLNTQYMTNSTLVCPVKIEYVTKNNIFGLKMMMKSGLETIILKFLHAQAIFY